MTRKILAPIGALALTLLVAATAVAKVETARAPEADFSSVRTYAFRYHPELHPDHALASATPIFYTVVEGAEKALARKGLEKVDSSPDVWISFQGYIQDEFRSEVTVARTGNVVWVGAPLGFDGRTFRSGTLIVEVFDGETDGRIWSAWVTEDISTPEKTRKKAGKAAKKLLGELPVD